MKRLIAVVLLGLVAGFFFLRPKAGGERFSPEDLASLPPGTIELRDENGQPIDINSLPPEIREQILRQAGGATGAPPGMPPQASGPVKQWNFRDRSATHTSANVSGWTVILERKLSDEQPALANRVLTQLEKDLDHVAAILPGPVVTDLRAVPIWIDLAWTSPRAGQYHWSAEGARAAGEDATKEGGVEISRAAEYLEIVAFESPSFILHELAHAWQQRRHGVDYPPLRAAYQQALASGSYNAVKHVGGGTDRAYALTDEREYFAELSEAYFWKNDFYPFTREELRAHDPQGYRMIEGAWDLAR
jgi:hypothetical protein